MELSIAEGKSRKTVVWLNVKTTWHDLVKRLSVTMRTLETYREYCQFSKEKQSQIKDHGGFVGGYLINGGRHPKNVKFRQILTLDLDFATLGFWDDFTMFYDIAAIIHSTHKHSSKTPRYRLVIPLDRPVGAEEYEAIGRKLAAMLGIDLFDSTTFQPSRLMYWPTTAKDGEYFFREQKGESLSVDSILDQYIDWSDISSWPRCYTESEIITRSMKQQADPLDKPGLIGAFCRTYDIHEAIAEFLPDIYKRTETDNRYTFTEGSGAAGAIVYEDKFLYSNHGTDPIHGQLCNVFDLVRLHKFGFEDTDTGEKEITKKQSYKLMCEFASAIPEVIVQVGMSRLPSEEFDDSYDNSWLGKLTVDKYANYDNTIPNFELILSHDMNLRDKLMYDKFNLREVIQKPVPWDLETTGVVEFTDKDDAGLRHYLEQKYGIYHATKGKDGLDMVFQRNSFHPITDYIDGLKWDGESRLDTLMIEYLGAEDNLYTRLVTRKAFTAAVARVYRPGCKFDYILTLVGPEGIKKSTLFDILGKEWFSDSFLGFEGTKSFEQLQGAWIIEMGELSEIKKSEAETVKLFVAKRKDRFRVAYGKRPQTFLRQCIFVATTNEWDFLKENNGNRRFWPVAVTDYGAGDIDMIDVDQIWAEAKHFYDAGEKLYLDPIQEEEAREVQRSHTASDDRRGLIHSFLTMKLPESWDEMDIAERQWYLSSKKDETTAPGIVPRMAVCAAEIWCELFRANFKDMTSHNTKYIHQILRDMPGWQENASHLTFPWYGKQRTYVISDNVKHHNRRIATRK